MTRAARLSETDAAWFEGLPEKLEHAADEYDLPNTGDWDPMAELSSSTRFEGIEVHGDAIIREGDNLIAPATVFVELIYDPNSDEPVSFHDSYPAQIFFSSDPESKAVSISQIAIDNSSFFE